MSSFPLATFNAVLDRLAAVTDPDLRPNHLILGKTGAGKTRLTRAILARVAYADRVLVLDPKGADDPSWTMSSEKTGPAPKTAADLQEGFGSNREGGGPAGMWFRLVAARDRAVTTRRFADALRLVAAEGACVVVLDDARSLSRSFGLADEIENTVLLGRSSRLTTIASTQDPGYFPVRAQASFRWIGHTGSLTAAKAACDLLSVRGTAWQDQLAALQPGQWIYDDEGPGSAGPCMFRSYTPGEDR